MYPIDSFQQRCLAIPDKRRHEHITSCLFLLVNANVSVGGSECNMITDSERKRISTHMDTNGG